MSDVPDLHRPMDVECVPILISVTPSTVAGGAGSLSCCVQIGCLPVGGCSVNVGCSNTSLLHVSGETWPFALPFPADGGTTACFTVTTSAVSQSTPVTIGACQSSLNAGNPANWQTTATVTLTPVTPP